MTGWREYEERYPSAGGLHGKKEINAFTRQSARQDFMAAVNTAIMEGDVKKMKALLKQIRDNGLNFPNSEKRLKQALGVAG